MSDLILEETKEDIKQKRSKFAKKKALKKTLGTCGTVLMSIFCAILLFLCSNNIYQQFINKDNFVGFFGVGNAVVETTSMIPTLYVDDLLIYKTCDVNDLQVDDIVVYKKWNAAEEKNEIIVHRLVSIADGYAITRGDNNALNDEAFPTTDIVGRYVTHIREFGTILKYMAKPITSVIIAAIIVILIVLNIIFYSIRRKKIINLIAQDKTSQDALTSFFDI